MLHSPTCNRYLFCYIDAWERVRDSIEMGKSDAHTIGISLLAGEVAIQLSNDRSVFFRSTVLRNPTYSQFDFALLTAFLSSLTTGEKFRLDHPVTRDALRQFENYSRSLRIMAPERFETPRVICSNVVRPDTNGHGSNGKIVALSGGIDSTYAALSTRLKDPAYTHCLLIKGFDYPLENTTGFDELRLRVEKIADELGLRLIVAETNIKNELCSYGLQHAGALACCLHLMAGVGFESGAYAADLPPSGDVLEAPWGNSMGIAATLTTEQFPIGYLGSEFGRGDKIKWLAEQRPGLFRHISVCHKEKSIGGNCGKCEKCARTRIGLMAISDSRLRKEVEISLFGDTADYREFFAMTAENPKSLARLFDLSASLPECEARQLLNDEIEKIIVRQKRIHDTLKRNHESKKRARKLLGNRLFKLASWLRHPSIPGGGNRPDDIPKRTKKRKPE